MRPGSTIIIWADVQATSLTRGDSLRQPKQCRPQSPDAFTFEDFRAIQGRPSAGNLDAVSVLGNTSLGKLFRVHPSMGNDSIFVISLGRQNLEEYAALDVIDVLLRQQDRLW